VVLLLTLFPWMVAGIHVEQTEFQVSSGFRMANAWTLGFSRGDGLVAVYLIFLLLAIIVAVPSALFTLRLMPSPPLIQRLGFWQFAIVGGLILLSWFLFFIRYIHVLFAPELATAWFRLAFWFHFFVGIAFLLEIWLEQRKGRNLPVPRIDMKW
jgi:hypothetical protein